jgi:ketosteroid isomerase-like protein
MSRISLLAAWVLLLSAASALAAGGDAETAIRGALTQWTADFNAGNSAKICDLFAPDLRADYRGQPERDFGALCAQLKSSLGDRTRSFSYALDIKEILVSGDVAIVRLVWTLTIRPKGGGSEIASEEPGMDVFQKQPDGSWKITRYMAYER